MIYNKRALQNILENDLTRIEEALRVEKSPSERERLKSMRDFRIQGINEIKSKYESKIH